MARVTGSRHKRPQCSTILTVRPSPLDRTTGIVCAGPLRLRCALGRSGTTIFKREGDGGTPVAAMTMLFAYHRRGRMARPSVALCVRTTRPARDGWCDAPAHPAYNRPVSLPFGASCETMARADRLYDFVVVLDWNYRCRRRGRGSAIFLHVARPGYPPTAGCIALHPRDIARLAVFLRPESVLRVLR